MNKKILFITNYFGNGGAATVMKIIAKEISEKEGYDVQIIAFNDNNKKYEIPTNIKYETLEDKSRVKRITHLRKIFKENKGATIISFEYFVNMQVIIANALLKNKLIISERNDPNSIAKNKKKLRDFLYKFCDYLVCQTPEAKGYFNEVIQKRTVVIPNPIKENLPIQKWEDRKNEIVTFCRIEKQKNLKMLVDAFEIFDSSIKGYKLYIYGNRKRRRKFIIIYK